MAVPLILFAHGAGAGAKSPFMVAWGERLSALGRVVTFEYPYMESGRRRPDAQPDLISAHRAALASARARPDEKVILAGKSMGSRIGCHVATLEPVTGLVCFGYPLRAATSRKLRDAVLLELSTPILFVSGTRDPLCPLEDLENVRKRMSARSELCVVEGADHSLKVGARELRARGQTQADVDAGIAARVAEFVVAVTS